MDRQNIKYESNKNILICVPNMIGRLTPCHNQTLYIKAKSIKNQSQSEEFVGGVSASALHLQRSIALAIGYFISIQYNKADIKWIISFI